MSPLEFCATSFNIIRQVIVPEERMICVGLGKTCVLIKKLKQVENLSVRGPFVLILRPFTRPDYLVRRQTFLQLIEVATNAVVARIGTLEREGLPKKILDDFGIHNRKKSRHQTSPNSSLIRGSIKPCRSVKSFFMILQKKQFYAHVNFTASVSATCRDFTQDA